MTGWNPAHIFWGVIPTEFNKASFWIAYEAWEETIGFPDIAELKFLTSFLFAKELPALI